MTKIFQKSLASVLALALCLTALITASATVSADASTTTATLFYEVSPEAPKAGDTVTVKLKASGFDTVAGADIYSTYSANITDGVLAWGLAEGQLGVNADVSHENNTIKMILEGASQNGVLDPITTLLADGTTLYTFTFTAGEAGTKYDFGFADDTKVRFCTSGEQEVTVAAAAKTVTVAANEPVCEHTYAFVEATPAVKNGNKGSITLKCSKCNVTVTEDVEYYMYYSFQNAGIECASEIIAKFNTKDTFLKKQGNFDALFVSAARTDANGNITKDVFTYDEAASSNGTLTWSVGIPPKNIKDNIDVTIYVNYNGKWYNGNTMSKDVVAFTQDNYAKFTDNQKRMFMDLIVYGSKAQIAFGYDVNNLATSYFTQEQLSTATSTIPTMSDVAKNNKFTSGSDLIGFSTFGIEFASKVILRSKFNTRFYDGNVDDITVVASYVDRNGVTRSTTFVSENVATAEQIKNNEYFSLVSGTTYEFSYSGFNAADMRRVISLNVYCGETALRQTTTISIEAQLYAQYNNPKSSNEEKALYCAALNYSDSAETNFS